MKTWTAKPVDTTTAKQITVNQDSMASRGHSDYSVWLNWFPAFTKWLVALARFRWDVHLQPCPTSIVLGARCQPLHRLHRACHLTSTIRWSWWRDRSSIGGTSLLLFGHGCPPQSLVKPNRKTENCDALLPLLKKTVCRYTQHVHILDLIGSVYSVNLKSVQLAGNLKIEHWENLPLLIKSYQIHIFSGVKLSWFHQSCSSCRALLPGIAASWCLLR